MGKRRLAILGAVLALALLLSGCEEYATYTPSIYDLTRIADEWPDDDPNKPTVQAVALERYATAQAAESIAQQAELTAQAAQAVAQQQQAMMTAEAGATADALSVRATTEALNVQATAQAMAVEATRTAEARIAAEMATRQAVQLTATAEARNAQATQAAIQATRQAETVTAQAVAAQATATIQAHQDNATATVISATAQAVALQAERERLLHPFKIGGVILLVLGAALALAWLGWRFSQVMEDRARVIRRRPDEGEPLIVWRERWALPLRAFSPLIDATRGEEHAPQLAPTVEAQEAATMRQQTANALQARQVGAVARAKSKAPVIVGGRPARALPSRVRPARLRGPAPGLVKVVAVGDLAQAVGDGILPPRLAEAIEGQWVEIEEV